MSLNVPCPHCNTSVVWQESSTYRPFCSKKCQLIDLGEWADEGHKISQPAQGEMIMSEEMLDQLEAQFLQDNKFFVEPE